LGTTSVVSESPLSGDPQSTAYRDTFNFAILQDPMKAV
jgi:hypothetical protein